jgi:hypothetical protein
MKQSGTILLFFFALLILMLNDVRRSNIWPPKEALLVGRNLVGSLTKKLDPSIPVVSDWGYDSQFFWAISIDPFMKNDAVVQSLDSKSYRYQRVLFPLIVWLLPGDVNTVFYRLHIVNWIAWLAGLVLMYQLSRHFAVSWKMMLLFYVLNPGMIFSLIHPLADLLATVFLLAGLLLYLKRRCPGAGILFALAGLTKETSVIVPGLIVIHHILRREWRFQNIYILIFSMVPVLAWQMVIYHRFHVWPFQESIGNFSYPYGATIFILTRFFKSPVSISDALAAAGISFLSLYMILRIRWPQNLMATLMLGYALFISVAGVSIMEGIGSSGRLCILFLLLFPLMQIQDAQSSIVESNATKN